MLVVDDNEVNRRILTEAARPVACPRRPRSTAGRRRSTPCSAAAQSDAPFRLVLLDANMPEMDGFAVAEQIARRPELAGATVMMLTSSGEYGDPSRCRDAGHLGLSHQADPDP